MSGYHNTDYNLPSNFDWIAYRSLNPDLRFIMSSKDAIKHYKQHGYRQNRRYTFEEDANISNTSNVSNTLNTPKSTPTATVLVKSSIVPVDPLGIMSQRVVDVYQNRLSEVPDQFDWLAYKSLNKDLRFLKSYGDAVKHYREHGHYQQRPYHFPETAATGSAPVLNYLENDVKANRLLEMTEVNYSELNKQNGIPVEFNWQVYKSCNPDLHIKTYQEAVAHYREHGYRESRKYSLEPVPTEIGTSSEHILTTDASIVVPNDLSGSMGLQPQPPPQPPQPPQPEEHLPKDFDWLAYKSINSDLNFLNSRADAVRHYLKYGQQEGRKYQFDSPDSNGVLGRLEKVASDYDWISYRPVGPHREQKESENSPSDVVLPKNFDWMAYKMRNPDLSMIKSQADAIKHYKEHGYRDHRPYVMELVSQVANSNNTDGIPPGFNWIYYRSQYPDLKYIITNEQEAIQHYLNHGQLENRKCAPGPEDIPVPPTRPLPTPRTRPLERRRATKISTKSQIPPSVNTVMCPIVPVKSKGEHPRLGKVVNPQTSDQPRIVSTPSPTTGMIPKIIHFIYGFKSQTTEFGVTQYIAIMSAYHLNKPDHIYFHYRYMPYGPLWDKVKPYLTLVETDPPTHVFDRQVKRYAHQADIVRLNVLNHTGGIYLDMDTICLRPVIPYLKYDFVMGIQGENYGLCNAVIMAKPETKFGQEWYQSYQSFSQNWDLHSVRIPLAISKQYPITIAPNDAFFYPLWDPFPELVLSETINYDCCHRVFQNSYCMHLWETWCGRDLQKTTLETLWTHKSFYHLLARKFVENPITILIIVHDPMKSESMVSVSETIASIGTWYSAVGRDEVAQVVVYNQCHQEGQMHEYLTHLPEINPKFHVIREENGNDEVSVLQIKKKLCARVTRGIICLAETPWKLVNVEWLLEARDLLYDESIGMIMGHSSEHSTVTTFSLTPNATIHISLPPDARIFRSELLEYGVHFTTDTDIVKSDREFCQQITVLGKQICMLTPKDVNED
uniref:Uncharacterized protein n=1 Tax=viral metagenome TaxID=1070528 RepID=A0A6C0BM33_9ZZZZ